MPAQTPYDLWREYAIWRALPRASRGDLQTIEQWALAHNKSERTVQNWRSDPRFKEFEKNLIEQAGGVGNLIDGQSVSETFASTEDADYQAVKDILVSRAKEGDPKAIDQYFRTYGKTFVAEEEAARAADTAGMDLEELVLDAVMSVGLDVVIRKLQKSGFKVIKESSNG